LMQPREATLNCGNTCETSPPWAQSSQNRRQNLQEAGQPAYRYREFLRRNWRRNSKPYWKNRTDKNMNVEDVFCSRLRMKILRILVQVGELNGSEIARRLNINYVTTTKHLKLLEDEDILVHKQFGRIRLYRLNEHSQKAKAVQALIEAWKHN